MLIEKPSKRLKNRRNGFLQDFAPLGMRAILKRWRWGVTIAVANSILCWACKGDHRVHYHRETKTLLVDYEFPDIKKFQFIKWTGVPKNPFKPVAKTQRRELEERLIYGLALRLVYDLAELTRGHSVDQIALNGHATFIDKATGREKTEVIVSMLVKPEEVLKLRLHHLEPKPAFRRLKGLMTSDLSEYSPVVPIMKLDKNDSRIVAPREVVEGLRENENIAAMDWLDFEHLIRELFEKEFTKNGMEVQITRASRDSGVDALVFDPDPLKGGKFVIQAKRYTRTVDVSVVRDLYGTLHNEGANRGILVTTSKYGPDSYEFARGKPITLIDGPQLLGLLLRHGYKFSIDLEAARRAGVRDG
jgi:restriction system protein